LLLEVLRRFVAGLEPQAELPEGAPPRLERSEQADKLQQSYHFWRWGEVLYARMKALEVRTDYRAEQFFAFLLHWLQSQALPPRLLWSPRLKTTPRMAFSR
jgi:hypothetical protein